MLIRCALCKGNGNKAYTNDPCPVCGGAGQNDVPSDHVKCALCNGNGNKLYSNDPCPACSGTGVVRPPRFG